MNPEQQRIAIAEACGWHWHTIAFNRGWVKVGDGETQAMIPDYLNNLNAMHEAENVLTADQWYEYDRLMPLRDPQKMHATAAQRAEAFLRAIGKWVEQ